MASTNHIKFEFVRLSLFLLLAVSYILVYFHRMSPAVISDELMKEFHTSGTALGSLAAVYFLVYSAMQIPSGVLADTLGPRFTIFAGNLIAGIGSIIFGLAGSFSVASGGRFLVGLGVSIIFISIMKFNSLWYSERRFASMSGVTLVIGNMGSILAAGPLATMLKTLSWRNIFISFGVLSLILSVLGYLFIRNRPEDFSFTPPSKPDGREPTIGKNRHWLENLLSVMKVRAVWPGFFANFGITGSIYAFMGLWGIPFLRDGYHLDRTEAAQYMTVMLVTFSLGGLFFGWLSDRIGRRKPFLIISSILYTGAWLALIYLPWRPGASGFVLFGFLGFAGTGCILTFACAKEIIKPAHAGMATSLVNTGAFLGTLIMQPLLGWVFDHTWDGTTVNTMRVYSLENYHNGFLLMIVFAIISFVGSLLVKETYCINSTTGMKKTYQNIN